MKRENSFEADSIRVFLLFLFVNGVNYLFQMIAGRILAVEEFGAVNTALTLITVLTLPGTSLQMVISKKIAEMVYRKEGSDIAIFMQALLYQMTKYILIAGGAAAAGCILYRGISGEAFNRLYCLIIVITFCYYFQFFYMGAAQGQKKFLIMSMFGLIVALAKIIGVLLAGIMPVSNGIIVLFGTVLAGLAVSNIAGDRLLRRRTSRSFGEAGLWMKKQQFKMKIRDTFTINIFQAVMMNLDIILVRMLYSNYTVGIYSSVMLVGRIFVYITGGIIAVFFPMVVQSKTKKVLYLKCLGGTLFVIICVMIPFLLFPKEIIILLFGNKYIESSSYIFLVCITAAFFSLNTVNMNFEIATGRLLFLNISFFGFMILGIFIPFCVSGNIAVTLGILASLQFILFLLHFLLILFTKEDLLNEAA